MPLILSIDTATEQASITLSRGETVLQTLFNTTQKDHASWIQPAIQDLIKNNSILLNDLDAIAVSEGPGSYTGLRVGMATAKGLCYALQKPLITENTLKVMAFAAREKWFSNASEKEHNEYLLCPMIDARRMEVFTALYNLQLKEIRSPNSLILDAFSYKEALNKKNIAFFGSGSDKWKPICTHIHANYPGSIDLLAPFLSKLAAARFSLQQFSDLAYSEPAYLKEFYSYIKK